MARRKKKINKRLVILLSVIGAIALIGIAVLIYQGLPKDPFGHARMGEKAYEEGDYRQAATGGR